MALSLGMKKPVKTNIRFQDYSPGQTMLLPPSLEDMIDANHPVRIVNKVIDQVEIDPLIARFKGGGTSSYHPRMLLKVVVFSYLSNIYSSRRMEAALKENNIKAFVKDNYFDKDQSGKPYHEGFNQTKLHYNAGLDCFYCPMGQPMKRIGYRKKTTTNGYEQLYSVYEATNCHGCPLRGMCNKQKGNRRIDVNYISAGRSRVEVMRPARPEGKTLVPDKN
jgi:hypothetical protein